MNAATAIWVALGQVMVMAVTVTCFLLALRRMRENLNRILQHTMNLAVEKTELNALIAKAVETKLTNQAASVAEKLTQQAATVEKHLTAQAATIRDQLVESKTDALHEQLAQTKADAMLAKIETNTKETSVNTAPIVDVLNKPPAKSK